MNRIVSLSCATGLLYFGREVLEPLALAGILTLVMLPLVRRIRQLRVSNAIAVFSSVTLVASVVVGIGVIIAVQVGEVLGEMPRYEAEIHAKIEQIADLTLRPLARLESELSGLAPRAAPPAPGTAKLATKTPPAAKASAPAPAPTAEVGPGKPFSQFFSSLWGTLGEAAIVLLLMIFMLLEHDSLRDRLIRFSGETDVARTMQVITDTSGGVSRFFFCQFIVNIGFASVMCLALWATGITHAVLWGVLGGVLRFVPYVGVPVAAAVVGAFAAAFDPGWSLLFSAMLLFFAIELLVANVIEPLVYSRHTGLAPLTVVAAALFWGTLWGPVGLLLSTPLTLCFVVAGRHVKALAPFTLLLGDTPGLTAALGFYKRVLSAEFSEILHEARMHLRRNSLAHYYDQVLFPGLKLAADDFEAQRIDPTQQEHVRTTIVQLAESLGGLAQKRPLLSKRDSAPVIDSNLGAHLRQLREKRLGRWQGSLDVPAGSVIICAGFMTERDTLLTELLIILLRNAGADARSIVIGDPQNHPGTDKTGLVAAVFITYPQADDFAKWQEACRHFREALPLAELLTVSFIGDKSLADEALVANEVDLVLHSNTESVAYLRDLQKK